jgi:hypothetical protein
MSVEELVKQRDRYVAERDRLMVLYSAAIDRLRAKQMRGQRTSRAAATGLGNRVISMETRIAHVEHQIREKEEQA